jgi:tetratricopeptide (TPR) repeat protein
MSLKRILPFILFPLTLAPALDQRLEKADYYFLNYHIDPTYLSKARTLCREVLAEDSSDLDAFWLLIRVTLKLGTQEQDKSKQIKLYEEGKGYAEKAKILYPDSPDAYHWYGVSLSLIIQAKGAITAISLGKTIKESFQKALELDPGHRRAMGGLGAWYLEAPAIAGGDIDKSIFYLSKALSLDPNYTLNYVYLARAYIKKKDYSAARDALRKCLAVKNPTLPAEFYLHDEPAAKKLLAEIEGK